MAVGRTDRGWFAIPGIRPHGDRTLAEQLLGLERALAECCGKSVLDLGCAEGLIGLEFAKAGAEKVVGIELLESHLVIARLACRGYPQMSFVRAHLHDWAAANPEPEQYDIVLALGIIHKLRDPNVALIFAARSARRLLCFRAPAVATRGVVYSKHSAASCNVPEVMTTQGFDDEGTVKGVRGESVQYWRRR